MKNENQKQDEPELNPVDQLLADVDVLRSPNQGYFKHVARTILRITEYYNDDRFDKVVALITALAPDDDCARDAIRMYGRYNNRLEEAERGKHA